MDSVGPINTVTNATPVAAPASPTTSGNAQSSSQLAQLQTDEGVVVSLGGQTPSSSNSPIDLYKQLSQLGTQLSSQQSAAPGPSPATAPAPAAGGTDSDGDTDTTTGASDGDADNSTASAASTASATSGSSSPSTSTTSAQAPNTNGVVDLNTEWANVLKSRPELATQAVQVESDQVLLSKTLPSA